jgi:hypothetical protein
MEKRKDDMSEKYSVEGHKSRTAIDDDNTELFLLTDVSRTLDEAVAKARECFGKDSQLGLAVIYKENPQGDRQGLKFIFKNSEGKLEEADLYWGNWECHES